MLGVLLKVLGSNAVITQLGIAASWLYFSMICCGVPRTLPSGPELSNTRLTTFPPEGRLRLDFDRERDLDDLIYMLSIFFYRVSTRFAPRAL